MSIEVLSVRGLRPEFGKVDRDLWLWFCEAKKDSENYHGPRVTKRLVQAKAKQAFQAAGILNFKASDGWYIRWLKRWNRSVNNAAMLNDENGSSGKRGETIGISKAKIVRKPKSKNASCSILKCQAQELISNNISKLAFGISNQSDGLGNSIISNTVTLSSSDLSANSPKDVSGSITPDDTFVSIGLNTTSQISIYSDFQERFSSKDCDLQNICHDVIPENNNFTPNSSFPLSVKELSWSDSSDTSYLEGQESSKVSQVQVIQKEHHVCINQTLPAASKQVSKQSLKGKGNLLDSQKCLTSSSFIHSVTQDTPKSTIESRLNWKGSSQNVCTGLQALHNLAVTNQASPKETGKSFSHTFTDFEVADCTSFAQQDLEDVSVSSDFVNHLNDEHSLDLSLEYGHGLLSQQISKKTLFSSKSIHNINLSCQSVQNGECDLSLSQPDCKRIVNGNSSKSGCHEIVSGENICNEENDYISEAVMLSMQEDDFSILDCDQSPFHGTISVVDENSQPDYEQVCNLDEGPQMTLGMKENANESMEIEFPSSCVSLYTTDGQEHVFIREIMKEKPSSGSSRQPPNNMIQEDNNCHILPHVECQEQSYISSILNEDCVESKRSQNSLLLNSHSLKTNLNSSFKSHIQVLSSLNENTDNQISSLDNGCYTSHEIYNLSPLLVEGENVCQGTSTESEIAFVEGQDFVRISASSFSNASITDQDVFLATYPDGGDLNSFPSTNLENTSLSVSHGALTSEDCSQEDSFEGILRTVPCESEKGANETSSTPIVTCDNSFLLMDSADYTENWEYLPGHTTENSREPSAVLTHHHHHDSLKENEITPCPTHLTDSVAYKQDKSFSSGGSSKLGKKSAPCLTERGKSNIVVEENHALYRRSSGDRYFPYFKERVANYAMKHTAKEAARYFGVNVDTVTMWTKGRQEQISTVNNQPDQVMLRWLKRNRESGIIHTRAQLFEKAAQLLKTPGNWVKDRSRWFYVWASRLVDDEERKRATSNTHEANLLPVDCGEKKALYPDEFKVEVVLYAEQTSKNLASTIFNIARKRVFEWTAAFKVSRDTWKGSHSIPEQSAATIDSDQSSTSSISGESLKVSTTLPSSFPSFGNGKPKLNGKGMGRAVTSVAVDRELWLWFCEQISKKSKPKSKDIRAKAVELFRAHNHNKIQCSHGWLKKWSVRYGIALRHEGDSDLLAWCLEQFDRNRNISHRDLLGHAHKSLTGTHKSEFKASAGWLVRFCKRHRSLLSTKPSIDIEIPTALRHHVFEFRLQTQKLIHSSKIPLSNVGCVDEVPLNFTAAGGSQSRLLLRRSGLENCHATVILCSLANGNILPPAIIFKGNGPTEHVSYDDVSLILFYQQDCCMTDAIMTQWLELVWNKNVASPSVLVADCYDPHCSKLVKEKCGKSDASLCIIPAGCAYKLQPLDLTVSRLFETCIYNKWTRHFAANDQISICKKNCYSSNSMIAQWVAEALKSLAQTQKEAVRRSFLVTGITSASNGTEDHLVEDPASIPRSSLFAPEV